MELLLYDREAAKRLKSDRPKEAVAGFGGEVLLFAIAAFISADVGICFASVCFLSIYIKRIRILNWDRLHTHVAL